MQADKLHVGDREARLDEILFDWLRDRDAGVAPSREDLVARHPDLADDLCRFLQDIEQFDEAARPLREIQQAAELLATWHDCDTVSGLQTASGLPPSFGDYELLEEIGRGGMGVVYKARQGSLARWVALKVIRSGQFAEPAEVARFRREAQIIAQLDHPQIVPVYEVGEHGGCPYFSMKLIEGSCLARRLGDFKDRPEAAARLVAQAARAMHHAHRRGVLHRDLKPSNILLDGQGRPHITDFGLARSVSGDAAQSQSGAVLGTPAYMAPEQTLPRSHGVTAAADIYALGAVLYTLLSGRPPFQGPTVWDTLTQVREETPLPLRRAAPTISPALDAICRKCLEKEPQRRYATAEALADDLECWLQRKPVAAMTAPKMRERLALAAMLGVLLLMAVSVSAISVFAPPSEFLSLSGSNSGALEPSTLSQTILSAASSDQTSPAADVEAILQAGLAAMKQRLWAKAREHFSRALDQEPSNARLVLSWRRPATFKAAGRGPCRLLPSH